MRSQLQDIGKAIVTGTAVLTWTGANAYATDVVVQHNMRRTPKVVTGANRTNDGKRVVASITSATPTTFTVGGYCPEGTPSANSICTVDWEAST